METSLGINNQHFSFFGKDSKIKGSFNFSGLTKLNSIIEGEIVMETLDDLSIEKDGSIKGSIKCHNLNIYGTFEGSILSSGKVCLFPCAKMKGKIHAAQIIIHPGSILDFEGHTEDF